MERLLDAALEINSQPNINIVEKDLADSNNSGKQHKERDLKKFEDAADDK